MKQCSCTFLYRIHCFHPVHFSRVASALKINRKKCLPQWVNVEQWKIVTRAMKCKDGSVMLHATHRWTARSSRTAIFCIANVFHYRGGGTLYKIIQEVKQVRTMQGVQSCYVQLWWQKFSQWQISLGGLNNQKFTCGIFSPQKISMYMAYFCL